MRTNLNYAYDNNSNGSARPHGRDRDGASNQINMNRFNLGPRFRFNKHSTCSPHSLFMANAKRFDIKNISCFHCSALCAPCFSCGLAMTSGGMRLSEMQIGARREMQMHPLSMERRLSSGSEDEKAITRWPSESEKERFAREREAEKNQINENSCLLRNCMKL